MNTRLMAGLTAALLAFSLGTVGCAKDDDGAGPASESEVVSGAHQQLDDGQLQGKLRGILADVTFISESDYGYKVFEGENVGNVRLSTGVLREKLSAAIKANSEDHRDIKPTTVRAQRLNVSNAIADGEAAEIPSDPDDDNFLYAKHDKQLMIALKTMRGQLKNVVGFTFGTNQSGDGDGEGNVLYVYVGVSKTSGKLIAIMTEAVYT